MSIREQVLSQLEENRGNFLSGETLSERLGVTRQAVWKAVKRLTAEGYAVTSVTNRGYMLDGKCDLLSSAVIAAATGVKVYCFDTVTSTNTVAKQKYCEGGECLVVADGQTEGRKKNGENFLSPVKKGIYMSLALPLSLPLEGADGLRAQCARIVADSIGRACGVPPETRNVDELYLNGKKVCGVLIEAETALAAKRITGAVIGIGIYTADVGEPLGHIETEGTRNALVSDICNGIRQALTPAQR